MFLTEMLLEASYTNLTLAHFHHDLRGAESDQDEAFCEAFAKSKNLAYRMEKWSDPKKDENSARDARYLFFERVRQETNAQAIVLGHHADDQAETIFLQFLRGAGPSGLSGMKEWDEKRRLYRPLLGVWKQDILATLIEKEIPFRIDSSNLQDKFTRNFLRNTLFPMLEERFQGFKERFVRNADFFRSISEYLETSASEFLSLQETSGGYSLERFFSLPLAVQHEVVRAIFPKNIDFPSVKRIEEFLRTAKSGTKFSMGGQEISVYGKLFFLSPQFQFPQ